MDKAESIYQICVPNETSVRVTLWSPAFQVLNEATGKLRLDRINQPVQDCLADASRLTGESIRRVGEALFECLFDNQLREDFWQTYREIVIQKQQRLQVSLEINERAIPELIAYPWELMRFPQRYQRGEIQLATDPKLSLVRSRYNVTVDDKPAIQVTANEPLKIALVVAIPTADYQLSQVEYQEVQRFLTRLANQQDNLDVLPVINPATSRKVATQLSQNQPDIFHFIGHGQLISENGKEVGQIALVRDSGEPDWKMADFFSRLFTQHRPKIVILQACETGKQSETDGFSSVASRLMLQGIPVVIAMQYQVSNQTVSGFVKDFYEEIVKGNSVNVAVQQARFNIVLDNGDEQLDFAIPVIYMNAADGCLWEKGRLGEGEQKSAALVKLTDELRKRLRDEIETVLSEDQVKSIFLENEGMFGSNFYNQIPGGDYHTRVIRLIRELENRGYLSLFIAVVREDYPNFGQDVLG